MVTPPPFPSEPPSTHEPDLAPEVSAAKGLRTGWTTGTCASAAAKAAAMWLVHGEAPDDVEVTLPSGRRVSFPVDDVDPDHPYRCAVVKDAGDDPDVTHGAHLTAEVTFADTVPLGAAGNAAVATPTHASSPSVPRAGSPSIGGDPVHRTTGVAGAAVVIEPPNAAANGADDHHAGSTPPTWPTTGHPATSGATGDDDTDVGGASGVHGEPGTNVPNDSTSDRNAFDSDIVRSSGGEGETDGTGGGVFGDDCTSGGRTPSDSSFRDGGVELRAGPGVGTITLPGLGLDVGAPAVNPVPRRMISQAVREVTRRPVVVTLSVPGGEAMAAKTSNDRLGIVGGISILGTSGIVRPFSTAAYRASVVQQVDVAGAQGQTHMVLSTGSRSDRVAQRLLPELPSVCFVEVGDFTGIALRRAAAADMTRVTWVGMAGKIAKLAAGVLMTHYRRSKVDGELLADAARACAAPPEVVAAATATATARHFAEVCLERNVTGPLTELCRRAAQACAAHVDGALQVEVVMVDFEGQEVVARA